MIRKNKNQKCLPKLFIFPSTEMDSPFRLYAYTKLVHTSLGDKLNLWRVNVEFLWIIRLNIKIPHVIHIWHRYLYMANTFHELKMRERKHLPCSWKCYFRRSVRSNLFRGQTMIFRMVNGHVKLSFIVFSWTTICFRFVRIVFTILRKHVHVSCVLLNIKCFLYYCYSSTVLDPSNLSYERYLISLSILWTTCVRSVIFKILVRK